MPTKFAMKQIILTCIVFACAAAQLSERECNRKKADLNAQGILFENSTVPCPEDPCLDNGKVLNDSLPCPTEYCEERNGVCLSKALPYLQSENPLTAILQQTMLTFRDQNISSARNLGFSAQFPPFYPPAPLPDQFPGFVPQFGTPDLFSDILGGYGCQRDGFPFNCGLNPFTSFSNAELLEPPLNVPYCQRIPCRTSDPTLEEKPLECYNVPGCYYDQELADLRRSFAFSIMPGVPVCHLAIRNINFQRLANEYFRKSNQPWSVLYTNCLINQNIPGIESPDPGCYALKLLRAINIYPKYAGWQGINKRECYLLSGCWEPTLEPLNNHHCYYPSSTDQVRVRAGEDPFKEINNFPSDQYGQPICRPFLTDTPQNYLSSYRQCKQAGCVTEYSVNRESLYNQFLKIALSPATNPTVRPLFWNGVLSGKITPVNYEEELSLLAQNPLFGRLKHRSFQLVHQYNFQTLESYSRNVTENNLKVESLPICHPPPGSVPFPNTQLPAVGSSIPQVLPPFGLGPQISHGSIPFGPGPQITQGLPFGPSPQIGPGFSPFGFGPQNIQGLPQLGPGRPEIIPGVPPFAPMPQTPSALPVANTGGSIIRNPYLIGNPLVKYFCHPKFPPLNPCPYQQLYIGNFPLLKGSFHGCCKVNLCYIPRPHLARQRSGPASFYSEYSEFGECSVSCGGGIRKRVRKCEVPEYLEGATCDGISEQTQNCNTQECPSWGSWTSFGECSATCGTGVQRRNRTCIKPNINYPNSNCVGNTSETRPCFQRHCPIFGSWESFSPCCCGKGFQTRERQCIQNCDYSGQVETSQRPCERFCGRPIVIRRGICNTRLCQRIVSYRCVHNSRGRNACDRRAHCANFKTRKADVCYNGRCKACQEVSVTTSMQCQQHLQRQER